LFNHSIIKATGQWWKVLLFGSVSLSGVILLFWGISEMLGDASGAHGPVLAIVGLLSGLFGFFLGLTTIYCPMCRTRWVWLAIKEKDVDQWGRWLLSQSECPTCKSKS
jgi:hypothetical protein